jgi:GTP-binding protein YchF
MGNKFLANIREADAILQVVRIFESSDITHVHGEVNPKSDIEVINMELIIADIESLTKKIAGDTKKARSDKDLATKLVTLEKAMKLLEAGSLVSSGDWNEDEIIHLKDSHLLTNKKFVYACNVSEEMMDASQDDLKAIIGVSDSDTQVVPVCAKLEEDMIEMSSEEKKEFLDDMGLISTGLDNVIKASYDALGLQYYFTAGVQEVRAWTVKKGASAPQAA